MTPIQKIGRFNFFAKPDWRTLQLEAKALLDEEQYEQAKKKIQQALILAPKKARVLRIAYAVYHEHGDIDQASEIAIQLAKRYPGKADHYILASHNLVNTGRSEEARKWLAKGLRRFPENTTLLNMKSELQMIEEEPITFAIPRSIPLPSEPLIDFVKSHRFHSLESESTEALLQINLNELDLEDPGEPLLYHCNNAIITRSYGAHSLSGHPYFGTVLARQKFSKDGRKWAKYPLGYPFKITTPRTEELKEIPIAFYITNALCDHFGHLLTEAVSSIHPLLSWKEMGLDIKDIPIILPANQNNQQGLRLNKLLRSLELTNSDFQIPGKNGKNLFVRDLFVARPSIILGGTSNTAHPRIVKRFLSDRLQHELTTESNSFVPDKIFISRSKLTNVTREIPGIHELELLLEESGWLIFHPQLHSMRQQINIYENAKYLCSTPGSALHLLYGLELKNLNKLILLAYESDRCHNLINYLAQFEAQSISHVILDCLAHEDNNSGIGEYFTNQKQTELRLEFKNNLDLRDLAVEIGKLCQ